MKVRASHLQLRNQITQVRRDAEKKTFFCQSLKKELLLRNQISNYRCCEFSVKTDVFRFISQVRPEPDNQSKAGSN